jgi:hypothetical protein
MRLTRAVIIAIISACVALGAASAAFAYPSNPADSRACADCHGREGSESTETVAATRKGPHGGYTAGTSKCKTCHSVHNAPAGGVLLLPGATVEATCKSCHDGTGGSTVYGAIKARTGFEPAASHSIEATNAVPGGDGNTGGSSTGSFSGPGGTLTCSDCHSPHDSQTVDAFTGDRLRASVASDTAYAIEKTNRLLKQSPTSAETSVSVYGAGWCATCHKGRVGQHAEDSGLMQSHPVLDTDAEYYYDRVQGVAGADTTETALGSLGQSNRGYVVPETESRPAPLCQQCHEDARNVGPNERGGEPMLSEDQTFTVSAYTLEESNETTDNPQFQVFPHESNVEYFLVRPVEPALEDTATPRYGLCLNCHSLLHEVPEEYASCAAEGCHEGDAIDIHADAEDGCDSCHAQAAYSFACADCHAPHSEAHMTTPELLGSGDVLIFEYRTHEPGLNEGPEGRVVNVDCAMCHTTDVSAAHANRCSTCHSSPRDSFEIWEGGCQQGDCHTTFHTDTVAAHWSTDDPTAFPYYGDCTNCHGVSGMEDMTQQDCLNCHTAYSPTDTTPPVTTSNAQAAYVGPALIRFSKYEGGKVSIGTTFYRVDGGPTLTGSTAFITTPGVRSLEYWSVDQNGNVETSVNQRVFTITADTVPPVTTSDAQSSYYTATTITLTPTDASTLGVKETYYTLNGGPVQSGTSVSIPASASGTVAYTLVFWSADWSGNVEMPNTVNFTVTGGVATIRLIWGGGPPPPGADAIWTVRLGGPTGPLVPGGSGSAGGEGWDGVDDIVLPVSGTAYYVTGDWYDPGIGWDEPMVFIDGSPYVYLTTPGQIVERTY